jgi:hypothetical protein
MVEGQLGGFRPVGADADHLLLAAAAAQCLVLGGRVGDTGFGDAVAGGSSVAVMTWSS